MVLAVTLLALPWGMEQAQAAYYANSPALTKFKHSLPGIGSGARPAGTALGANDLGQYLPVATPDATYGSGTDYYEIGLKQYSKVLHSELGATTLRGYYQINGTDHSSQYPGPLIVAGRNRPVRIKFINQLTPNSSFFLPVDTTVMGAGAGPTGVNYSVNRATLHLHGGFTPWISDGTPHQWITPNGETTPLSMAKGASFQNVPDMIGAGIGKVLGTPTDGMGTFYYPNQQSSRLMFYHDHAFGITRLNVYAGEAAGYLLTDSTENTLQTAGVLPGAIPVNTTTGAPNLGAADLARLVPLIIQDKTFVDTANIATQDPLWAWGNTTGSLWFPHVYEFNQSGSAGAGGGGNPEGRWDYGPYVWPPAQITASDQGFSNTMGMPIPATAGDVPQPSIVPEAFMDTMVVNGTPFPYLTVAPTAYRFRILNACNDRMLNLQLYFADTSPNAPAPWGTPFNGVNVNLNTPSPNKTEVSMVPANGATYTLPSTLISGTYNTVQFGNAAGFNPGTVPGTYTVTVPFDGRVGGVPDPRNMGPQMIQIGNEGGLLPQATVLANVPIDYDYDRRSITLGNVRNFPLAPFPNPVNPSQTISYPHSGYNLHLGPAERADIIIDFSGVPAGSKLILYNDAPAPEPGFDPRQDYYTNNPDYSATGLGMGGAPSTQVGKGPNTRTIMQFEVSGAGTGPFNYAGLLANLPAAYNAFQPPVIVNTAQTGYLPVQLVGGQTFGGVKIFNKTIAEDFDPVWGRMNAVLGTEQASTNSQGQQTFGWHYADPNTELLPFNPATPAGTPQIWKITHNGVDTHAIHFHLFNVQLLNRVDWAGMIKPPEENEKGWKETIRMNPLEDIYVAVKPIPPGVSPNPPLPWLLPDSVRLLDPTMPKGMTNAMFWGTLPIDPATGLAVALPNFPFTNPWPYPLPGGSTTVNNPTNFGWEYVWHCHLLGHEENDMMRAFALQVSPAAPTLLNAKNAGSKVTLGWTNNETVQTNFTFFFQRATNAAFTTGLTTFTVSSGATNLATYATTNTIPAKGTYFYRVRAQNAYGFSDWSNPVSLKW